MILILSPEELETLLQTLSEHSRTEIIADYAYLYGMYQSNISETDLKIIAAAEKQNELLSKIAGSTSEVSTGVYSIGEVLYKILGEYKTRR